MASQGEKTEKPTGRRLQEARKKGQVARSRDLVQVGSMAAALGALAFLGPSIVDGLGDALAGTLSEVGAHATSDLRLGELVQLQARTLVQLAALTVPVLGAALGGVLAVNTAQGGWVFASEALKPNWSRLNPAQGLSRLGFKQGGMDLLKSLLLLAVLGYMAFGTIRDVLAESPVFARMTPMAAAATAWRSVAGLLWNCAVMLGLLALADYGVQRWRVMSSLKMTKDEVREEAKMTEGNPAMKARVRAVMREMSRKRMLKAVPQATVVVTNPTHYAVALLYDRRTMSAPRVVAKGRSLVAAQIKALAREHGVPTVENVPLAQALYKSVDVGETIPAGLFAAVAEVLSYLIRIKQLAL